MSSRNTKLTEVHRVTVARTQSSRVKVEEPNRALDVAGLISGLTSVTSPLAVRPAQEPGSAASRKTAATASVRIRLTLFEGAVEVNGRKTPIALGLSGTMTVREMKRLLKIYEADAVFVRRGGGLERLRDSESVELVPGTEITHRRELPHVSRASFSPLSSFATHHGD